MRLAWGVLVLLVVCAGAKLAATEARADGPVTVAFTEVGAHSFTVPAGVTSIHVVAVGASGGMEEGLQGGRGAIATADIASTPGQVLNVFVGGQGGAGEGTFANSFTNLGGFNGGGKGKGFGDMGAGGGGGASDIRTGGPKDFATRLVVAGGGGGAGNSSPGGDAGQAAGSVATVCGGGGAGSATAGGSGGIATGHEGREVGGPGSLGSGGDGKGGGGGGGLFGGGAGGATADEGHDAETCGGGGGSSGFGPGTSATSVTVSVSSPPSVTITYAAPSSGPPPASPGGSGSRTLRASLSLPVIQHGKAVVGTVRIGANRSSLNARLFWQASKRAKKKPLVGSLTEAPLKKGLHSFTVKLNKKGLKRLEKLGKLKLTLAVKVTPPQGAAAAASKQLTLKP